MKNNVLILGSESPRRETILLDLGLKIKKYQHHINEHKLIKKVIHLKKLLNLLQ